MTVTTAEELKAAVAEKLAAGRTDIEITLNPDAPAEMITAIRDTEGVADGSIHLTLGGVATIPGTTNRDGVAFGLRYIYDEAGNIIDDEYVTQLASIHLPDVTNIGDQAFYGCSNLASVSAPKAQTIGMSAFGYTALTSVEFPELTTIPHRMFAGKVDLVLCCDKKDAVTFHDDGTATWQVRDDLSYTFKSITFVGE